MGLLVNTAGAGGAETADGAKPLAGEKGPYLQEMPKSASTNNGNTNTPPGTYTWVVVAEAKVHAIYLDDAGVWQEGSAGTYP